VSHKWDVIVIGGGIWGLACAYENAKRGRSVALFEAGKVGQGTSGGLVGAMAPHVPDNWNMKKQFQFDALVAAPDYWAEIEAVSQHTSGFDRIGRLTLLKDERERALAEQRVQTAQQFWGGRYAWQVIDGHDRIAASAAPFGIVCDTISGRLHPTQAVKALELACRAKGVEIFENHRVTELGENIVFGVWGQAQAEAIILAGGTEGFTLLDYHLGCNTGTAVKGQAALLDYNLGALPQVHSAGIYIVPHADGTTGIGSTVEKTWGQPFEVDEKLDEVIAAARIMCPELVDAPVISRWAGLRPKARRRHPMLGPVPDLQGVYVAMGAFTIGFSIAHQVAGVLADYVQGTEVELPKNFSVAWHVE